MNAWIKQMFDAEIVDWHGIIRRKKKDVHRNASLEKLIEYARERQYHVIETGNQYIVVCNPGALKIHC